MDNNKALADVQPGGRVRLGDQAGRAQRATDNAPQNDFADADIPFVSMQGDW